jgi:hypothetical protein
MTLIADGGLTTAEIKGMGIPLGDAKKLYAEVQQLVQTRGGGAPSAVDVMNYDSSSACREGQDGDDSIGGDGSRKQAMTAAATAAAVRAEEANRLTDLPREERQPQSAGRSSSTSSSTRESARLHVRARSVGRRIVGQERVAVSPPVEIQLTERLVTYRTTPGDLLGSVLQQPGQPPTTDIQDTEKQR